ncbi:MAG: hypothetical protein Fur0021_11480 [Candidatus Promineifilaceae bacterium]
MIGLPPPEADETEESEPYRPPTAAPAPWRQSAEKIWRNLRVNVFPENLSARLLPGEEVEVEIKLAWYRNFVGRLMRRFYIPLLFAAAGSSLGFWAMAPSLAIDVRWALLPLGLYLAGILYGAYQYLEYLQRRLVKTNFRIIFFIPVPEQWPLVDAIDLKGLPAVVDTNWSPSPIWRFFQIITGARDLYISMVPFQFEKGQAQVKGALIIPDVMPEDVRALKEKIFTKK